jgi:diguanylate cyclase (GGDEF)-like protein
LLKGRYRFVLLLCLLLTAGFVTTSLVSYLVAHRSLSEQIAGSTLPLTSDNIYSEIQRDLLRPVFISSLMAQDTFLRDWVLGGEQEPDRIIRYLAEIQQRYGAVTSFFVSERSRRYYHPTGILKSVSDSDPDDAWYARVRDLRAPYDINVDSDTADRTRLTIFVNYRVLDYDGRFIGATGVGLEVDAVRELVDTYQRRYGRRIYFIDRTGHVTLHGDGFDGPLELQQRPGLDALATRILTSPSGSHEFRRDGQRVFVNSREVPEFDWLLLVEQEEGAAENKLQQTLLFNLLLSLAVTAVVLLTVYFTVGGYQRRLEQMATTDKLTGAANRHVLDLVLERDINAIGRRLKTLSILIADIDRFKAVNDLHGHLVGDSVIRSVAATVRRCVRDTDTLFRWGGEELLVLLPDCDLEYASRVAEKVRAAIAGRKIVVGEVEIAVTASLGVAELATGESAEELLRRTDRALYQAKSGGRDRIVRAD